MKNSQKGFIVPIFLGIIAILVIGGSMYFYKNAKEEAPTVDIQKQQSDQVQDTSNWKVYRNEKYGGFKFKYPDNFTVVEITPDDISGGDGGGNDIVEWQIRMPVQKSVFDETSSSDTIIVIGVFPLNKFSQRLFGPLSAVFGSSWETIVLTEVYPLNKSPQNLWWYSDAYADLTYDISRKAIMACGSQCSEIATLPKSDAQMDTKGNNMIALGKNWRAFILPELYGSGLAREYLIPDQPRNQMIILIIETKYLKSSFQQGVVDKILSTFELLK